MAASYGDTSPLTGVSCLHCGFLHDWRFSAGNRSLGSRPDIPVEFATRLPLSLEVAHSLECWRHQAFDAESGAADEQARTDGQLLDQEVWRTLLSAIIEKPRDCAAFFTYQPGYGPEEHLALMNSNLDIEREERRHRDLIEMMERHNIQQLAVLGFGVIFATIAAALIAKLL